jgi:hypothetical protein
MKGENSGTNGSYLNKNNILKPTFDTLTKKGHKAFEAYRANLEQLFLSHCEVTRHGTVLNDTTPIVFHKHELIPEVRLDPSPSHNDIQYMINYTLERQARSTSELLRGLIEERNGKKNLIAFMLILLLLLALLILLKSIPHKWYIDDRHYNAKLICPAGEQLS